MHLSVTQAIRIGTEIALSTATPYRFPKHYTAWREQERSHPSWNKGRLVRAAVSLAPVPKPH